MGYCLEFSRIPDIVTDVLDYDPISGALTWKAMPRFLFSTDKGWRASNTRKSGKRAEINHCKGYYRVHLLGKTYLAHRVAVFIFHGDCPVDWQIDHINGNKKDNRSENLRIVKPSDQQKNLGRAKNNSSGFTGVTWDRSRAKWSARIKVSGKTINLGRFITLEEAISARKTANARFGFHENHGKIR